MLVPKELSNQFEAEKATSSARSRFPAAAAGIIVRLRSAKTRRRKCTRGLFWTTETIASQRVIRALLTGGARTRKRSSGFCLGFIVFRWLYMRQVARSNPGSHHLLLHFAAPAEMATGLGAAKLARSCAFRDLAVDHGKASSNQAVRQAICCAALIRLSRRWRAALLEC